MSTYHYSVVTVPNRDFVQLLNEELPAYALESVASVGSTHCTAFLLRSKGIKDCDGSEDTESFGLRCAYIGWSFTDCVIPGNAKAEFRRVAERIAEHAGRLGVSEGKRFNPTVRSV